MEAVRVLRRPMTQPHRSGTFAMVTTAAIDDVRMGAAALRVLVALGHYRDAEGWCWPRQKQLAARIGVSQQAVSKALRDLDGWGYIEIHDQYDEVTGARTSSRYRVILDYQLPVEYRRTPQPDVVGSQLEVVAPTTSEHTPHNATLSAPQPDVVAKEELTQKNKPKELTQEVSGNPAEQELFAYYRQKIQPKVRINAPEKIRTRLKRFSLDELKAGIDNFAADSWWMDNNATRGVAWFFDSDRRSEQFLNLKPRPTSQPQRSGADRMPPGAASKQRSNWATDFRGRYGTNLTAKGQDDGR